MVVQPTVGRLYLGTFWCVQPTMGRLYLGAFWCVQPTMGRLYPAAGVRCVAMHLSTT